MNLSYSSIQRYGYDFKGKRTGCGYSYFLRYISNIPPTDIDSKYGSFGKVIHNILANFYQTAVLGCIPNYPTAREYFNEVLKNLLNTQWDYTLSETMFKDALSILGLFADMESKRYENFKQGVIVNFNPLHIELSIKDPFNIRIDKVLHDHTMIDYKTTKNPPELNLDLPIEYLLQAGTYAISYHEKYKIWPSRMVYYFLRTSKNTAIPITQQIIDLTSKISNEVIDNINAKKFNKNPENCEWCDYRHVCGLETIRII